MEARVTAWEDGAWFRDGLMAHAKKQDARRAAARLAAE
jgi:ring-1,2-phenylacetyl-CoA epoxidase subunit PaaA